MSIALIIGFTCLGMLCGFFICAILSINRQSEYIEEVMSLREAVVQKNKRIKTLEGIIEHEFLFSKGAQ